MPILVLSPGAKNSWSSQHAFSRLVGQSMLKHPNQVSDERVEKMRQHINSRLRARGINGFSDLDLKDSRHAEILGQLYSEAAVSAGIPGPALSDNVLRGTMKTAMDEFELAEKSGVLLVNGEGFTASQKANSLRAFNYRGFSTLGIRFTDIRNRMVESVDLEAPGPETFEILNQCAAAPVQFVRGQNNSFAVQIGKPIYEGNRFKVSTRMQNFCRNQLAFGEMLDAVKSGMGVDIPPADLEHFRNIMVSELGNRSNVKEFDELADSPENRAAFVNSFGAALTRWYTRRVGGSLPMSNGQIRTLLNDAITRSRDTYKHALACTVDPAGDKWLLSPSTIPINTLGVPQAACDNLGLKQNEPTLAVHWADIYDSFNMGEMMVSPFEQADNQTTFRFKEMAGSGAYGQLYYLRDGGYRLGKDLGYRTIMLEPSENLPWDTPSSAPVQEAQPQAVQQPVNQPVSESDDRGQYAGYEPPVAPEPGDEDYDPDGPEAFGIPRWGYEEEAPNLEDFALLDIPDGFSENRYMRATNVYAERVTPGSAIEREADRMQKAARDRAAAAGHDFVEFGPEPPAYIEDITMVRKADMKRDSDMRQLFSDSDISFRMQMDYFARHAVYRDLVDSMNAVLAKQGLDKTHGVKTTTACLLLDRVENFAYMHPRDLPDKLREAIDQLPSDAGAKQLLKSALDVATEDKDGEPWYAESVRIFEATVVNNDILTLSPFDLNFRNRRASIQRGNKAIYARFDASSASNRDPLPDNPGGSDLTRNFLQGWGLYDYVYDWQHDEELMRSGFDPNTMDYDTLREFSNPKGHRPEQCRFVASANRGEPEMLLSAAEDLSGLSALRPYMSPKDYQAIASKKFNGRPWCAAYLDANGKPKYMSGAAIERVRQTVEALRMAGEQFSFEPDSAPGQIRIKFDNGMTMRMVDPANEDYAGNCIHINGTSLYYQIATGGTGGKSYPHANVTPEMALDLVRYARGEKVERRDDLKDLVSADKKVYGNRKVDLPKYLGEPMSVTIDGKDQQMSYFNKERTMFNTVVSVGNLIDRADPKSKTGNLVITCNFSKRKDTEMCFDDVSVLDKQQMVKLAPGRERAEAYLRKCVDEAKIGFQKELNIEALIEEAMVRRAERNEAIQNGEEYDDSAPMCMSTTPDIAAIQAQYWDVLMGNQNMLMRPGYDSDDFESADDISMQALSERAYFNMDAVDMVRAHANDLEQYLIGEFEPTPCIDPDDPDAGLKDLRFNPVLVNRYMSGANMSNVNSNNITNACRAMNFTAEDLRYTSFGGAAVSSSVRLQRMVAQDKMVKFNPETARDMFTGDFGDETKNAFMREMGEHIRASIQANGCRVKDGDILIDDKGIVHYKATRAVLAKEGLQPEPVEGEIGRLYAPEPNGVVRTRTHCMVPGYSAYIEPNKPGENKPYEERMVLKGYKDIMKDAISYQIRSDMTGRPPYVDNKMAVQGVILGSVSSLDSTLRHITSNTKYPHDFLDDEKVLATGMSLELRDAIIATMSKRVKFDKEFMAASNEMPVFSALNGGEYDRRDLMNDRCMDALTLTGYRNIALLDSPGDGMFDPYFTGNAGAQGVRYLVEGATIDGTGHVVRADKNARCEMVNYLERNGRHPDFDSPDRMNMTGNGLLQCIRETEPVGVAQMTAGMWTLDDGLIVSKKFAETYSVPGAHDGEQRPLCIGDKIECHGNKGVIGIVIDPDMPEDEAEKQGVLNLVKMFRANENLDVIMSSYSGVSRFNAGLAAEAIDSEPEDLVNPITGEKFEKCIGHVRMTVLKQTADSKTHFEDEASDMRSYGAQMSWALAATDCPNIMKDTYRTNMKAASTLREMLIVTGMDMDPTGRFEMAYTPHAGEVRNVFPMSDLWIDEYPTKTKTGGLSVPTTRLLAENARSMDAEFNDWLEHNGGFMEIPFELEFPCRDDMVKQIDKLNRDADFDVRSREILADLKARGITRDNVGKTMEYKPEDFAADGRPIDAPGTDGLRKLESGRAGHVRHITVGVGPDGKDVYDTQEMPDLNMGKKTYLLPVMSSYLRAGQEFEESGIKPHDYTQHYLNVYKQSVEYRKNEARRAYLETYKDELMPIFQQVCSKSSSKYGKLHYTPEQAFQSELDECARNMDKAKSSAQGSYNKITKDIETRRFTGKRNIVRSGLMANKQANSCTAIWTADPRLGVDEMGMNPEMMQALGIKDGDYCLVHRDPVLRGKAVRYMKAKADPNLTGVSVHPAGVPKGMDGDFDGDTVGPHSLPEHNKAARIEAMNKLSVAANLLDYSVEPKTVKDENGNDVSVYPLFVATGQDVACGFSHNPELQKRLDKLTIDVNRMESDDIYKLDPIAKDHAREKAIAELNSIMRDSAEAGFGADVVSYASKVDNVKSVEAYVKAGAKGKASGVDTYAKFLGVDYERDENGEIVEGSMTVHDENIASRSQRCGVLKAKNVQQQFTGSAGTITIHLMSALTNIDPEAATEIGHKGTQTVLQVKHSPEDGMHYTLLLTTAVPALRNGTKLRATTQDVTYYDADAVVKDAKGEPVLQADGTPMTGAFVSKKFSTWQPELYWNDKSGEWKMGGATRDEFAQQYADVYNSKEGFNIGLKQEYIDRLADILAKPAQANGSKRVMNMSRDFVATFGAPMQKCAYGGDAHTIYNLAFVMATDKDQPGMFDMPKIVKEMFPDAKNMNICMADGSATGKNLFIRDMKLSLCKNDEEREQVRASLKDDYVPISRSDTLVDGKPRVSKSDAGRRLAGTLDYDELLKRQSEFLGVGQNESVDPLDFLKQADMQGAAVGVVTVEIPAGQAQKLQQAAVERPAAPAQPVAQPVQPAAPVAPDAAGLASIDLMQGVPGTQTQVTTPAAAIEQQQSVARSNRQAGCAFDTRGLDVEGAGNDGPGVGYSGGF